MKRLLDIQTGGSLAVVSAFIASESAAWLLSAFPASSIAWHLNVGLFRAFENARLAALPSRLLFGPKSLPIAIMVLVLIAVVHRLRSRFAVALFANLSFFGSVMLAYAAICGAATNKAALPTIATLAYRADLLLVGALLATSFIAFAVSHWSFARAIRGAAAKPEAADLLIVRARRFRLGWRTRAGLMDTLSSDPVGEPFARAQGAARRFGSSPEWTRRILLRMIGLSGYSVKA